MHSRLVATQLYHLEDSVSMDHQAQQVQVEQHKVAAEQQASLETAAEAAAVIVGVVAAVIAGAVCVWLGLVVHPMLIRVQQMLRTRAQQVLQHLR